LGLSAKGPQFFGAQSSADISVDFAGGSPTTSYGVTAGLLRLRTARVKLDWDRTSVMIGQDVPFFSPLSPTSYATVLEPAMSWAGNLWVWTPEIELEHRVPLYEHTSLVMQGGVLDPLTEEYPHFKEEIRLPERPLGIQQSPGALPWIGLKLIIHSPLVLAHIVHASSMKRLIRLQVGQSILISA